MRIVVGITGATGAPYADRLLRFLAGPGRDAGIDADVVFTKTARVVWQHEIGTDPGAYGFPIWHPQDFTAPFASGSARYAGMVVIPCTSGMMARMAHGVSTDLVGRAADVMLKERRRLIVVLRETPLSLIHLRNATQLVEAGATLMPATPAFYSLPTSIPELVDTVVARVLDHLGVDNELHRRWAGLQGGA